MGRKAYGSRPCVHCGKIFGSKGITHHEKTCWNPPTIERLREIWGITAGDDECWIGSKRRAREVLMKLTNTEHTELHVLHTCDQYNCVNPAHLYFGTVSDNMRDAWARHPDNDQRRHNAADFMKQRPRAFTSDEARRGQQTGTQNKRAKKLLERGVNEHDQDCFRI